MRLRKVREVAGMKQQPFADRLGIPIARLKSYEHARAPVRYFLGAKLCQEFDVNQAWLAGQSDGMKSYIPVSAAMEELIPRKFLFSEVFRKLLAPELSAEIGKFDAAINHLLRNKSRRVWKVSKLLGSIEHANEANLMLVFQRLLKLNIHDIPAALYSELLDAVDICFIDFKRRHRKAIIEHGLRGRTADRLEKEELEELRAHIVAVLGASSNERQGYPISTQNTDISRKIPYKNPTAEIQNLTIAQRIKSARKTEKLS